MASINTVNRTGSLVFRVCSHYHIGGTNCYALLIVDQADLCVSVYHCKCSYTFPTTSTKEDRESIWTDSVQNQTPFLFFAAMLCFQLAEKWNEVFQWLCSIELLLNPSFSTMPWSGNLNLAHENRLSWFAGLNQTQLSDLYDQQVIMKTHTILDCTDCLLQRESELLPSARRYRVQTHRTQRLKDWNGLNVWDNWFWKVLIEVLKILFLSQTVDTVNKTNSSCIFFQLNSWISLDSVLTQHLKLSTQTYLCTSGCSRPSWRSSSVCSWSSPPSIQRTTRSSCCSPESVKWSTHRTLKDNKQGGQQNRGRSIHSALTLTELKKTAALMCEQSQQTRVSWCFLVYECLSARLLCT